MCSLIVHMASISTELICNFMVCMALVLLSYMSWHLTTMHWDSTTIYSHFFALMYGFSGIDVDHKGVLQVFVPFQLQLGYLVKRFLFRFLGYG